MSERDDRLRKLEPKLGEKTARALWLAGLDPKLRKHVDPFIGAMSDRLLEENYRERKVLLPPPSAKLAAGPVPVGQVWYDGPRGKLGLFERELVKHVGVVGSSGSGKTTFALRTVRSLVEAGISCVVFDPKRTWRSLVADLPADRVRVFTLARPEISPFYWNPLIPPDGIPAHLFDSISTQVGDEVLYGGLGSRSVVKEAVTRLRAGYPMPASRDSHFTMAELSGEVKRSAMAMSRGARRAGDWSATAIRITSELASPPLGSIINVRRNVMEADVDSADLVVFECDLMTKDQFVYLVTAYLLREYFKRLDTDTPDELEKVVVFEEAARIFGMPYPQPTFETVLREVREKGVGLFWITQCASDVNSTAWANTNSLFVGKQISAKDINAVGQAVAFEKAGEKKYASRLRTGEFIVRLPDRYRFPFLIRTRDLPKKTVSDDRLKEMSREWLKGLGAPVPDAAEADAAPEVRRDSGPETAFRGYKRTSVPVLQADRPAGGLASTTGGFASKHEEYEACKAHLIAAALDRPDSPVTYLYSRLGLSKAKGTKVKKMLLKAGLAGEQKVPAEHGGISKRLVVSELGESWLDANRPLLEKRLVAWETKRFGGPKSRQLGEAAKDEFGKRRGWRLLGEEVDDGFGGKWDQLWQRPDGTEAVVEIVTGESKAHEAIHVQKAMSRGLPIVCFCWDADVCSRIERYLADQGRKPDGKALALAVPSGSPGA